MLAPHKKKRKERIEDILLSKKESELGDYLIAFVTVAIIVWVVGITCFSTVADANSAAARAFYTKIFVNESVAAAGAFYAVGYADLTLLSFRFNGNRASISAVMVVCFMSGTTHLLHSMKILPVVKPSWADVYMPPAKMLTWIPTNVLLIFSLAEVMQLSRLATFTFMGMQGTTVMIGLCSLYVDSPWCWLLLAMSAMLFLPFIVTVLYISIRRRMLVTLVQSEQLRFIGVSTALLWCAFPVLFFTGALGGINAGVQAQLFVMLDVVTKLVFTTAVMGYRFKEDSATNMRKVLQLTDANKAQRQFLRYAFHEVRVPFNSVVLGIEYLLMEESMVEYHDLLRTMKQAGETMSRTLDDVLSLAKIEGKLQLESRVFDMSTVMSNTLRQFQPALDSKKLWLRYGYDAAIPAALLGDDHRLAQVVSNLISNAAKFSQPHGAVEVMVLCRERTSAKCNIDIAVADWGAGIAEEDQRSLFTPFSQVRPGELQKSRGSGLGLAISKHIVELQDGRIALESKENVGSRFTVTLPFKVASTTDSISNPARATPKAELAAAAKIAALGSQWPLRPPDGPHSSSSGPPLGSIPKDGSLSDVMGLLARSPGGGGSFRAGGGGPWGSPLAGLYHGFPVGGGGASGGPRTGAAQEAAGQLPASSAAMQQMAVIFQQYCEALDHMLLQTVRVALPFAASTAAGQHILPPTQPIGFHPWVRDQDDVNNSRDGGRDGNCDAEMDASGNGSATRAATPCGGGQRVEEQLRGAAAGHRAKEHFQSRASGVVEVMEAAVARRRREGLDMLAAVRQALATPFPAAAAAVAPAAAAAEQPPGGSGNFSGGGLSGFSGSFSGSGSSALSGMAAASPASFPSFSAHAPVDRQTTVTRCIMVGSAESGRASEDPDALSALVVDDVKSNRSLVMMLVRKMGWQVDSAENGQEAVNAAAARRYDIILMDNVMPVMTGVEATAIIKRSSPEAVIIGVTGNALEEDLTAFREAGARMVLTKPVRKELLQQQLDLVKQEKLRAFVDVERNSGSTTTLDDGCGGGGGGSVSVSEENAAASLPSL